MNCDSLFISLKAKDLIQDLNKLKDVLILVTEIMKKSRTFQKCEEKKLLVNMKLKLLKVFELMHYVY